MKSCSVQALLRRALRGSSSAHSVGAQSPLAVGRLWIDRATREARFGGRTLALTTAEFELLRYLGEHAGEIMGRERICRDLRGIGWDGFDRTIDIRVARLRRKLGDDGKNPEVIKSVRGEGYMLVRR